jgi:hypothetical protein
MGEDLKLTNAAVHQLCELDPEDLSVGTDKLFDLAEMEPAEVRQSVASLHLSPLPAVLTKS